LARGKLKEAMKLRQTNLSKLSQTLYDVVIIGGGINGAVAAAALTARGLKTALIDRGDFAGETSQHSSNLAWGGIKYMETFEFGLVRKLCMSRNALIRAYPSTVQEIRFYMAHPKKFRHSRLKLYAGGWLYWLMGNGFTRPPRLLSVSDIAKEESIIARDEIDGGFEYSDAYLHDTDARFVFNFVRLALNYGCVAANYVEALGSSRRAPTGDEYAPQGVWETKTRDVMNGKEATVRSRVVINACGPWVDALNGITNVRTEHEHVLSKGIHLIVRKLSPNPRVLTFFADDGRMFFVIPMGPRTCIGTTDTRVTSPEVEVTPEDRRFVLDNINKRLDLDHPLTEADVIAERCGVRPLVVKKTGKGPTNDWLQLSRKHAIETDASKAHISVFGGKLTDCLNVGEEICREVTDLGIMLPYPKRRWYGEPAEEIREEFFHQATLMSLDKMTSPKSSEMLSTRLWRRYAGQAIGLLENIRAEPRMAEVLIDGAEYLRCEIEQAGRREMITKLDDFLRRRSKISLVTRHEELQQAAGLKEACRILFGSEADERFYEYFGKKMGDVSAA
jgi:glycerol-3-phosphate dehydrogenase